jgi:YegS/Rv2252/BmrU family lipid kinase
MTSAENGSDAPRVAVIFNPTKISDSLQESLAKRAAEVGLGDPLWLETTAEDPGRAMTEQAQQAGVDVVVAAGGDGTVRVVASGLADSGIPLAIIPAGTANLLARNLGIPLSEDAAIDVAFGDHQRDLDVIAITTDDNEQPDRFAVMAGIGLDAAIMSNADETLKDRAGGLAYVVAAVKQLGREPARMRVRVDDGPMLHRRALVCLVGNVGAIQGDLELIPGAKPDDGLLDVVIASPRRLRDWLGVLISVISRRKRSADHLDQLSGRRVTIELDQPDEYELDGDTMGTCQRLVAEIEPAALQIRMPASES